MISDRGYSLTGILIAVAISSLIMIGAVEFLNRMQGSLSSSVKRHSELDDVSIFESFLIKYLGRSDIQIFGFTSDPNQQVYRMVLPLPGRCADLTACPDQVSLAFSYFDDKSTPFVTAVCALPTFPVTVIFDIQADPMSTVALQGAGFAVTSGGAAGVGGTVNLAPGSIVSFADIPYASLWVSTQAPAPLNFTYVAATKTFSSPVMQTYPECSRHLDLTVDGNYSNRFYSIRVNPLQLLNFFSAAALPNARNATGQFPTRVFNASILSVGVVAANASEPIRLAILECDVQGQRLACANEKLKIANVLKARVGMSFSAPLGGGPVPQVYDVVGAETPCEGTTETCAGLRVTTPANYRALLPGETYTNLSPAEFSLIKLEKLASVKVRYLHEREEKFNTQSIQDRQRWDSIEAAIP